MRELLQTIEPRENDETAIKRLCEILVPNSVILLEIITNTVLGGCVSGYFMRRLHEVSKQRDCVLVIDETLTGLHTGKVWSWEHIQDFRPDMVVFGKGMQMCGLAQPTHAVMPKDDVVTTPAHASVLLKAEINLKLALKCLQDESLSIKMREFVESIFDDVEGVGMLLASRACNKKMTDLFHNKYTCTELGDVYRFTFFLNRTSSRQQLKRHRSRR